MKHTPDDVRKELEAGSSVDEILISLRQDGFSPLSSIRLIIEATGMSLAEAKAVLSNSRAWADIHNDVQSLHAELEEIAVELNSAKQAEE